VEKIERAAALAQKRERKSGPGRPPGGPRVWIIGHGMTRPSKIKRPDGMGITFYAQPGASIRFETGILIIESRGEYQSGYPQSEERLADMYLDPLEPDEVLQLGDLLDDSDVHRIGAGTVAVARGLCGAQDSSTCDHTKCSGVLGVVSREISATADVYIVACRRSVYSVAAGTSREEDHSREVDKAFSELVELARKEKKSVSQTELAESASTRYDTVSRQRPGFSYNPGDPEFQADLRLARLELYARARDKPD
jgi:hypothetical protein